MFPFRKQPPTKAELVKKGVSDAAHALMDAVSTDKLDELKKVALGVASHAVEVAHHAGEVAAQKAAQKLDELQHTASDLRDTAREGAYSGAAQARETAAHTGETAAALAAAQALIARESAQHAKELLQERAAQLAESAVALKESWQDKAAHQVEDSKKAAEGFKKAAKKEAKQRLDIASDAIADKKADLTKKAGKVELPQVETPELPEIKVADSSSKWAWILLGLALGALLALLFAPTSGRRSRAAIKDRLGKVGDGAADAATVAADKAVDIAHRVEGIAHKVEAKIAADTADDDDNTIADRVRSMLGHNEVARKLERINVEVVDGVANLRGPMLDPATQDIIIKAVQSIAGVKDVTADFLTDEEPVDPALSS